MPTRPMPEITLRAFVPPDNEPEDDPDNRLAWPPEAARFREPPTAIQPVLPTMSDLVHERRRGWKHRPLLAAPSDRGAAPDVHLTAPQVAKACNVAPRTACKWIDSGQLRGYRLPGANGQRRVRLADLVAFCKRHGMPCQP